MPVSEHGEIPAPYAGRKDEFRPPTPMPPEDGHGFFQCEIIDVELAQKV
jgi:hypothetical protein